MSVATDTAELPVADARQLKHLQQLEAKSIHILHEVVVVFETP